jgi:ABC-type sugar transport system substrate-binding protein
MNQGLKPIPPLSLKAAAILGGALATMFFCGATAAQPRIAFLAPDQPGENPFWTRTIEEMRAAADDLDVELEIAYSKGNTYSNRKDGMAMLTGDDKPDYFLTGYWPGSTDFLIKQSEEHEVNIFVFNSGVSEADRDAVGTPRGKHPRWIGQMTPDDRHAGYELADILVGRARAALGADEAVRAFGLGGGGNAESDRKQRDGLEQRLNEDPKAVLERFVFADWSRDTAYNSLLEVLDPGTPVSVIWSGGDGMALGGVKASLELDKTPGKDIFIGGIGWGTPAIESVVDGNIEALLGGHFLEGAWALVLLHDYHNGYDFADDLGVEFQTRVRAITADNARAYLDKVTGPGGWSAVDFRRFSKEHNPELRKYEWPLEDALEQLETAEPEE